MVRRRLTSKTELLVIGSESRPFHDDEEEEADNMFLVASSMEPNVRSEGCLLVGSEREINPSAPGVQKEIDMVILDRKASVPLSAEQSAQVPRNGVVPSRLVLVEKFDDKTQSSVVKARLR